ATRRAAETGLAGHLLRTGKFAQSEDLLLRLLDEMRDEGDAEGEASVLSWLGMCLTDQGRLEEARECCEQVVARAREIGNVDRESANLGGLALVLQRLGRVGESFEMLESALRLARKTGNLRSEAAATCIIGNAQLQQGRFDEAAGNYRRYREIGRECGSRMSEMHSSGNLSQVEESRGNLGAALELLDRSLAVSREIKSLEGESHGRSNRGAILMSLGLRSAALDEFREADEVVDRQEMKLWCAWSKLHRGRACRWYGEYEEGVRESEAAASLFRAVGSTDSEAFAWMLVGEQRSRIGDSSGADEALERALELASSSEDVVNLATVRAWRVSRHPEEATDALARFEEHEERCHHILRMETRHLLWEATDDPAHLDEAHRLLCHLRDHAPEEYRETMIENVPLHRDIMASWEEHRGNP
ncbi:MAG: tetratricopeptide repeat protein, partial [Planctomycetota bacterium]